MAHRGKGLLEPFAQVLAQVFASSTAHVVAFPNPLTGASSANTVYVATG